MNDIHVTPWCFRCDTGFTSNRDYQLHWGKVHLSKESIMNDQMEQVWRSKDGVKVGSKEEVEAYLATLSPLGKMRFPYWDCSGEVRTSNESGNWTLGRNGIADTAALVAFANLAPLFQPVIEAWDKEMSAWRTCAHWTEAHRSATRELLLAYEEALNLVPR